MFSRSYHSELSLIRELAWMYSNEQPQVTGLLGERGGDPDAERLLQGFAFLVARIRERIDDAVPELVHELCEAVAWHCLRPVPAASIVEFSVDVESLRERTTLRAGTEVAAEPIEGTACKFRTTSDLGLVPLALEGAVLESPRSSAPILRLQLASARASDIGSIFHPAGIRLFLHGEHALATTLWFWLMRHCRRVEVQSLEKEGRATLLPACLAPIGLQREHELLPWLKNAAKGGQHVLEYFTLPQKFLFVDILNLDSAREAASRRFELDFHFDASLELPAEISADNFRLHCVPVVNLFSAQAEPIACEPSRSEYLIRIADLPIDHAMVFSVDRVMGRQRGSSESIEYTPYSALGQGARSPTRRPCFRLWRRPAVRNGRLDTWLSVSAPSDGGPGLLEDELLSIDLTCTNGTLASELRVGDIAQKGSSKQISCRNIIEVAKPVLPPLGNGLWRFAGLLGRNAFEGAEGLRSLLALHDFSSQQSGGPPQARAGAIRSVKTQASRRLLEGAPMRGLGIEVELDEAGFSGQGDLFLFGCILDELFAAYLTCNSFSELKIRLHPSKKEIAWQPRIGGRVVL